MKKISQKTALVLSLVFALATAYLWQVSFRQRAANTPPPAPVLVVVPRDNIQPRTLIKDEMLRFQEVPADQVSNTMIRNASDVSGKVAQAILPAGKPITLASIASVSPAQGLPYLLKSNMRAVTVAIDPVSGVAGFMKAGDRVDVMATYSADGTNIVRTVLQDIELLAIGNRPTASASPRDNQNEATADAPTATMAVTPEQMQVLALAAAKAKIHLALRSASDQSYAVIPPNTTGKIFGFPEGGRGNAPTPAAPPPVQYREVPPPAPAPRTPAPSSAPIVRPAPVAPAQHTVDVVRGTDKTKEPVNE